MSRTNATTPKLRCAIYTRKSSEEGLDQAFNSLHAQREACEAYIRSQAGEGWTLMKTAYDDGGISGGTMERPGLQRLLADIDAGRLDVVVVYKVDRLTRSLTDFAKIVERFDQHQVSFVSVTQQFNTTSSMGRLTLNVLLSFAQFEREVTGERIRDKIAASKAKGMWMGGLPPLGYDPPTDPSTRALVVNPVEAELVRHIFTRYLALGSVHRLGQELNRQGLRSKTHVTRAGRQIGGLAFSRGALFHLLKSRLYLGEIPHKGESYPGRHPPIVDRELFDAVQAHLAQKRATSQPQARLENVGTAPLKRLVFDADGQPMSPAYARGRDPSRRYRYYVSAPVQQGRAKPHPGKLARVPAQPLEALVLERVGRWAGLAEPGWTDIKTGLRRVEVHADAVHLWIEPARLPNASRDLELATARLTSRLRAGETLGQDRRQPDQVRISIATCIKRRGGRARIITPDGQSLAQRRRCDQALVKGLRSAHILVRELHAEANASVDELLAISAADSAYQRKLVSLAYLAPDIQDAILQGRQPQDLNMERLMAMDLPLAWIDQRRALGFAQAC